ncbi:hypothetical protein P12x_005719 [Tundrisphaera lichenicola]|uniref:hypothetical protein n=1 Tax=Tundrisphaera lichenicola TaxID=2029860 RepID=UPI003EBF7864
MRSRPIRPLTLMDVMVLVAATAAAFAMERFFEGKVGVRATLNLPGDWLQRLWVGMPTYLAVSWSLALIPLRWAGLRPSTSRIARQPGMVACVATIGAMILGIGLNAAQAAMTLSVDQPGMTYTYSPNYYWYGGTGMIGPVVTGAWVALALGGRWSPERSWIDRLGRLLGAYWVISFPMTILHPIVAWLVPYVPYLSR